MKQIKLLFLFALVVASSFLYTQQDDSIDPWKFIEYKLITVPQALDKKGHILRLIPAILSGGAAGSYTHSEIHNYITKYSTIEFEQKRNYVSTLIGILSASFVYGIADAIIQHEIDAQTVHSFITQWPEYKKYTPQQLHTFFDDVYEMYLFDPYSYKYSHNALDALTIARNHVYYQFPENYGFLYKRTGFSNGAKRIINQLLHFAPVKMVLTTLALFV